MPPLTLPDPPLTDGVITLREHRPDDREAVVAALQDPEIPRWTTVPSPYGPADYDAWMARARDLLEEGRGLALLVVDDEDRVLGAAGLHETDSDRPDIGYWIAPEHRGRGLAARAVNLLREHARTLGFERVDLLIHHDNEASKGVARTAGFEAEEELTTCPRDETAGDAFIRFTWTGP